MSRYIDGFVIPVPKANLEEYRKIAELAATVWRDHGALDYWECVAEDTTAENMISFPQLAQAGPDDTVVFAWIVYQNRSHRDDVNAKVMADPRMEDMMQQNQPLFDCSKMAYGGFEMIVQK
jgi:uncharacterized protein YbaA (DUF1428 family)